MLSRTIETQEVFMNFFTFLTRWLLSHMIIFVLAVSPVLGADDISNTTNQAGSAEYKKGDDLTKALNQKGENFKVRYIEDLMMATLSLVLLGSGIPKRNDRIKSDCDINIAGPISVGLLKLGGIIYAIGIAKMNNEFAKLTKQVEALKAREASAAAASRDNSMQESKRLLELEHIYSTYKEIFEAQKEAMRTKKKLYTIFEASLLTGMAFDLIINKKCNKMCKDRKKEVLCALQGNGIKALGQSGSKIAISLGEKSCKESSTGWISQTGLGKNLLTFQDAIQAATVTYSAPISKGVYEGALTTAVNNYYIQRDLYLVGAHQAKGNVKAISHGVKTVKEWVKATKVWSTISSMFSKKSDQSSLTTEKSEVTSPDTENQGEKTGMQINDGLVKAFDASMDTYSATVTAAETSFKTAITSDVSAATTAATTQCTTESNASCDNPAAVVGCHGIYMAACVPPRELAIQAAHAELKAALLGHSGKQAAADIAVQMANEKAYAMVKDGIVGFLKKQATQLLDYGPILSAFKPNQYDKLLGDTAKYQSSIKKLSSKTGEITQEMKDQASEATKKTAALQETIKTMDKALAIAKIVPEILDSKAYLSQEVNCCGSEGLSNKKLVTIKVPQPDARLFASFLRADMKRTKLGDIFKDLKFVQNIQSQKMLRRTSSTETEKIDLKEILKLGLSHLGLPSAYADEVVE
jgi:hypothetical protein